MQCRIWILSGTFKKLLEDLSSGSSSTNIEGPYKCEDPMFFVDKAYSKTDFKRVKRSAKNENLVRSNRRSMASKNSIWYDTNACSTTWTEAIFALIKVTNNTKGHIKQRVKSNALLVCADHLDRHQCVLLHELYNLYADECRKELGACNIPNVPRYVYHSTDARDFFQRHLPVVILYKNHEESIAAFVVKKMDGVDWAKLIEDSRWPSQNQILKDSITRKLHGVVDFCLKYASTEKDRQMLKFILAKATSRTYMRSGKLGTKFDMKSTRHAETICNYNSQQQENNLPLIHSRLAGSGRPEFCTKYKDLTVLLLKLFDVCGEGLRSHPRLICDTLFVETAWTDMPRAVSTLQQLYNIPISVSTAYTYTKNYRTGSYQAKRHRHTDIADISLHKSTRDLGIPSSINSHYCTADVQYSLTMFHLYDGAVVARDNKAKVHCDVEVVQRPSKSWVKVQYADHDWQKSSERTLTPSTYQFVTLTDVAKEEVLLCELDGIPVVKTRVTGPAVTLIKAGFFEPESCYRHLNELLYVLSLEEYQHHFIRNGKFVSQLLITVDGGGDERPRNKMTHFTTAMLRWLLDMDKVKTISYAERDSKLHSVERVHPAENRALSQNGIISSHKIHDDEYDGHGFLDISKMRENMNAAAEEAVKRIHGTNFAKSQLHCYRAPNTDKWIFGKEEEEKIRKFLESDTTDHRIQTNFILKPRSTLWTKLCNMYNLCEEKVVSAVRLFNECYEPGNSWHQNYAFTVYRPNEDWRGTEKVRRFEIQPIIDVGQLPDFHYLPYGQVEKLVDHFEQSEEELPYWLTCPDFYLPSRNLNLLMNEHRDDLDYPEFMNSVSALIGVSVDDCHKYVLDMEKKKLQKKSYKSLLERYKDTPIGKLTVAQLRDVLKKMEVKVHSKVSLKGELLSLVENQLKAVGGKLEDYFS